MHRGGQDPDPLLLERYKYSPTVTTINVNVVLQLAANLKFPIALGELKNAFCQSLVSSLTSLGYVQSCMDPCLFKLHHRGLLSGLVAIEVDDLLTAGNEFHQEMVKQLQKL